MPTTAFPIVSFQRQPSPGRHPIVLSQGEVRPGVKQGQYWGAPPSWGRSAPPVPAYDINTTVAL